MAKQTKTCPPPAHVRDWPRDPRVRFRVTNNTTGPSLTEQHHARACDINTIMAKYVRTGLIEHVSQYEPRFGDVSKVDFQDAMFLVKEVESEFQNLPAYVRAHYGDAQNYLEAISTPEGVEALRSLRPPAEQYTLDGEPDLAARANQDALKPAPDADSAQKATE